MDQYMAFVKIDFIRLIFLVVFYSFSQQALALLDDSELLRPEQAFKVSGKVENQQLIISWDIAEGYYLYRDKFKITAQDPGIVLVEPVFPAGKIKDDENFGRVEIYRNQLSASLPLPENLQLATLDLLIQHQGCADLGICYPPQKTELSIALPGAPVQTDSINPLSGLTNKLNSLNLLEDKLLPPDQAFQLLITVTDANTLNASWQIAKGYYLYREKTELSASANSSTQLAKYVIPNGIPRTDEAFGEVEIFYDTLSFDVPLIRSDSRAHSIQLIAKYQGCADRGVCYPPIQKTFTLDLPASNIVTPIKSASPVATTATPADISEQDLIAKNLGKDNFWLTLASFFGFGLLLAFTPCIFPMIPILSGIIVGQGGHVTAVRGFLLSLSFVIASALAYTVFGILAALFGSNLQADLQQPWIIILFSTIFVLLALSMFGFYNLELPKALQAKLNNASNKHRNSGMLGAALMGAFSALIVGPCVAAPLAGALIFIGQSGDAVLGGAALFVMGLGMGAPLLALGASAGSILPKAGQWLNATKALFGVIMLAVAVWMLERILPSPVTMFLWALLLILPAIFLSALDTLPENSSGWRKIWKGLGLIMLIYGTLLLIGLAMGNNNPLKPLQGFSAANNAAHQELVFQRIVSVQDLDRQLQLASAQGQWVMLDYYADWCISCKEMEAYTFSDPEVQKALANFVLLQADVTQMNDDDKALLEKFKLIGPPAILFFNTKKQERKAMRVVGYLDSDQFIKHLQKTN